MSKLIIIGGGGHAKVIADMAIKAGFDLLGFLDDNPSVDKILGIKRLGFISDCENFKDSSFVIGIGDSSVREKIVDRYNLKYATIIHPSAIIGLGVEVGTGTVIMAGAVINADAKIGNHSIVNTSALVEHDCQIGDFSMLAPHSTVCGFSKIGNRCWIGANAVVNNTIEISDDITVGSGAAVVKNLTESGDYVGVPVRRIK